MPRPLTHPIGYWRHVLFASPCRLWVAIGTPGMPLAREDRLFHNFVIQIGAKEFLRSILETYNIISFSYQVVSSEGLVRSPNETLGEHLAVIEAICDRDPEAAENLMRSHFKKSAKSLTEGIAKLRPV